jgi:hypothetical protein
MLNELANNALAAPRLAWILPVWPLVIFALINFFLARRPKGAAGLSIVTTLGVLLLSLLALARTLVHPEPAEL